MTLVARTTVLALLALLYAPLGLDLARVWWTDGYAAHVLFVPAFSAVIAYGDRMRLRAAAGRGDARGLALVAAGVALFVVARWTPSSFTPMLPLETSALATTIAGLVAWVFGWDALRHAAFPVGFLAAMAPLPHGLINIVTGHLQSFVAAFAATALDTMNIPVLREGRLLHLSNATLEVAEICNGLRFLAALVVIVAAFAHMIVPGWKRRVVLVLAAIPIATVANALRVTAVALATHRLGPQAAHGFIHDWIGKVVWALTLGFVMLLAVALRSHDARRARGAASAPRLAAGNAPGTPRG